jgi:hypothetical protein
MFEWLKASSAYTTGKDTFARFNERRRQATPDQLIELRKKWKLQFEKHIVDTRRQEVQSDVIIRDVKRLDAYPNLDENKKGISPWVKLSLVGTYRDGIMVGDGWGTLTKDGDAWRYTDYKAGEKGYLKVMLVSSIAYENVEEVQWNGDEHHCCPHISCWFDNKKLPYERTAIYVKHDPLLEGSIPWFEEVADVEDVRKRSIKHGLEGKFS